MLSYTVSDTGQTLLPYLFSVLEGWKRKTVKDRLKSGAISVNDVVVQRHDHELDVGDVVVIGKASRLQEIRKGRFRYQVLFLDEHVIAVDKPSGLLSVPTDTETHRTALQNTIEYLASREGPRRSPLWTVHRLDKKVSGVLLFARSEEVRLAFRGVWPEVVKHYVAIVPGTPDPPQGTIQQPLYEGGDYTVRIATRPGPDVRDATTHYRTLSSHKGKSLLEIRLETGRKHQIRAHLAFIGSPILGDTRYGGRSWGPHGIALHASKIQFPHPVSGKLVKLTSPTPKRITERFPKN